MVSCTVAREVLQDCELALEMLEEEVDLRRWRVLWAGAVSLLRSVGHVLDKVDGRDPRIKVAANAAFKGWKGLSEEHVIFREFIEKERNSILKEYAYNHHPSKDVEIAVIAKLKNIKTGELSEQAEVFPVSDNNYRPMVDGYCEGDDVRDVYSEAVKWWYQEIDRIEKAAVAA